MTKEQIREIGCLTGWKQIANYFNVSIATVKRWHKKIPLPIKRAPGGAPFASKNDLDRWGGDEY